MHKLADPDSTQPHQPTTNDTGSCNEGAGSRAVVLERRRDLLLGLVVPCETVDTGLDENEAAAQC